MTAGTYVAGRPPLLHDADELWDEYLRHQLAAWKRLQEDHRCHIRMLEYLGMTAPEYMVWLQTGRVADRVRRVCARDRAAR